VIADAIRISHSQLRISHSAATFGSFEASGRSRRVQAPVLIDVTRRQMTNVKHVDPAAKRGPANVFVNAERFVGPLARSQELAFPLPARAFDRLTFVLERFELLKVDACRIAASP
jgi:hypothetical protein